MHPVSGFAALKAQGRHKFSATKRAMDIVFCIISLPVLATLTLAWAILLKLVSPGPVFFLQERVGFYGSRFKIYKFRTMRVAADTSGHQKHFHDLVTSNKPMVKLDALGDSRLIRGGWLLRASGLDEFPQVINVLKGEMSLVGPRPCLPAEYEKYNSEQRQRFYTPPGLTGLWQVSGKNRTTFSEMIQLDVRYVQSRSVWLDTYIILATLPALLQQIGDTRAGRKKQLMAKPNPPHPFQLPEQPRQN